MTPVKYVFITDGVVSGLGKGITTASFGRPLKARGYRMTMQRFDPYININSGTMNPVQHREVFVTDNDAETDLDLGRCEHFVGESLTKSSNVITGKVYWTVLQKGRRGDFGGGTVQVIPHITNEIKSRFRRNYAENEMEIAIIETGGTVGDIESQPFLEITRQLQHEAGPGNTYTTHVTLIPYLEAPKELKTKPTQASVKDLQGVDVQSDTLVCRGELPLDNGIKTETAQFCNVSRHHVLQDLDVDVLYGVPLVMEEEHLAQPTCECLGLPCPRSELANWRAVIEAWKHPKQNATVALIGRYIQFHDTYIPMVEALKHAGVANRATAHTRWVDSGAVTPENVPEIFKDVSGILVPGGFGDRSIDRKTCAIQYVREHHVPFLGLCLGMQLSIVEFARNAAGCADVHSVELNPATTHSVIHLIPEQNGVEDIGGILRPSFCPCALDKTSKVYGLYDEITVYERHRHRHKIDNGYRAMPTKYGMTLPGLFPDGRVMEMIGLPGHPWSITTQAHPELKSRSNQPHPLFKGFVEAALKEKTKNNV